jgi:hypothetical protein
LAEKSAVSSGGHTLGGLMARRQRCTECREWFVPEGRTGPKQRVCGDDCRLKRRRKLSRRRRSADVDAFRADERLRQRKHRAEHGKGHDATVCHAPASVHNGSKALVKVKQIVDKAIRRSRAGLDLELGRITGQIGSIVREAAAAMGRW